MRRRLTEGEGRGEGLLRKFGCPSRKGPPSSLVQHPSFTNEETGSEKCDDLPNIPRLLCGRPAARAQIKRKGAAGEYVFKALKRYSLKEEKRD